MLGLFTTNAQTGKAYVWSKEGATIA